MPTIEYIFYIESIYKIYKSCKKNRGFMHSRQDDEIEHTLYER